jgi:AhpD family alkylhydroperoxidase
MMEDVAMTHSPRLAFHELAPKPFRALLSMSNAVHQGPLGKRLTELVFLRVSQINGCAFCIDMHWRSLIAQKIDARVLNAVAGWREAPFFSERERAVLRWAEIVNALPRSEASDDEFTRLRAHFSDPEIAELGFAIASIRSWNSLNVSFQSPIPEAVE